MASSTACERGAEEQTVDHVVLQCPIQLPSHALHGLTVLDNETIECLLNTCPEIWCGLAVVRRTGSEEEADNFKEPVTRKSLGLFLLSSKVVSVLCCQQSYVLREVI